MPSITSRKHPDCEDRCQLKEHKGYNSCFQSGECAWLPASEGGTKAAPMPASDFRLLSFSAQYGAYAEAFRSAQSAIAGRHWVFDAAEAHRPMANALTMGDRKNESKHILWMLDQIKDAGFSPTKACRWLGWIQASLYVDGVASLDALKSINKAASDGVNAVDSKGKA